MDPNNRPDVVKWKFYQENFPSILEKEATSRNRNVTDVTLVSDEMLQFQAHKCVLSASSLLMKEILLNNAHSHPVIFLNRVKANELQYLLHFFYHGQANICYNQLGRMLEVLKDFELQGFEFPTVSETADVETIPEDTKESEIKDVGTVVEGRVKKRKASRKKKIYECKICEITYKTSAGIKVHKESKHDGIEYECEQCDYKSPRRLQIRLHRQSKHEGIRYQCDKCDYTGKEVRLVKRHKLSVHEGIMYKCDQCDHKVSQRCHLRAHKKRKHEEPGVEYECDICNYKAPRLDQFKNHRQSKHEGVKYECDRCDYKATAKSILKDHQKSKHDGVRYNCYKCDYKGTRRNNLRNHIKSLHEGKVYECEQCAFKAKQQYSLKIHQKKWHAM